jgi:hypothetical protein
VVIVAGFIATRAQWDTYERDLAPLFADYGVKKFHAIDFRRRKGDFKGWPRLKLGKFNSRFLKLADDHLACGLAMVLRSALSTPEPKCIGWPEQKYISDVGLNWGLFRQSSGLGGMIRRRLRTWAA